MDNNDFSMLLFVTDLPENLEMFLFNNALSKYYARDIGISLFRYLK